MRQVQIRPRRREIKRCRFDSVKNGRTIDCLIQPCNFSYQQKIAVVPRCVDRDTNAANVKSHVSETARTFFPNRDQTVESGQDLEETRTELIDQTDVVIEPYEPDLKGIRVMTNVVRGRIVHELKDTDDEDGGVMNGFDEEIFIEVTAMVGFLVNDNLCEDEDTDEVEENAKDVHGPLNPTNDRVRVGPGTF